ncbi:unnamed protein product [Candidula unifasciata]|uniref:Microtubule-associated protein n=1 Tax=Candidula unifasciata TaxID=100452 RepID=A0A8S3Z169_9EUPU|nr:unnamed protein product [Candidula unifasciata]
MNFKHQHRFAAPRTLNEHMVIFGSTRPIWKYWANKNENIYRNQYRLKEYVQFLPPVDLGWRAEPVVGSLSNVEYRPGGGDKKIFSERLHWRANAKIGSLDSKESKFTVGQSSSSDDWGAGSPHHHIVSSSRNGDFVKRKPYEHIEPKVGSLDNIGHVPGGGHFQIHSQSPRWKKESKIGSLDNIDHNPQKSNVQITHRRLNWHAKPKISSQDYSRLLPRTLERNSYDFKQTQGIFPRTDYLRNNYVPVGGSLNIPSRNLPRKGEST